MRMAPTLASRKQRLIELVDSAKNGTAAEQDQVAQHLSKIVENDSIFLLRIEATKLLGQLKSESAIQGLDIATRDADPDVRKAAAAAWKLRGDETAVNRLQGMVASDTNLDVRLAATRALGFSTSPQSLKSLGMVLDDPNPAVRFRATESLAEATGERFGADVGAWKKYLATRKGANPTIDSQPVGEVDFNVRPASATEELPKQGPF